MNERVPGSKKDATPGFEDLIALAQEIATSTEAPIPATAEEVKKTEVVGRKRESPEAIAQKEIAAREKDAFDTGRFMYYALVGDQKRLDKEEAPGLIEVRFQQGNTAPMMGEYKPCPPLDFPVRTPEDYLAAFDKTAVWTNERIAETQPATQADIDRLYTEMADHVLFYDREEHAASQRTRGFTQARAYRVRDFPKQTAWGFIKRGVGRASWEAYMASIRKSLEGFSSGAMEYNDTEVALDGWQRLNMLNNEAVVGQIREVMGKLAKSTNPDDRTRLQQLSRKILELRTQGHGV